VNLTVAYAVVPSKNRANYVNAFIIGKGWVTVDPSGNITYSATNIDENYQQFIRNGLALEIAPGDDYNPNAMRYVLIPE